MITETTNGRTVSVKMTRRELIKVLLLLDNLDEFADLNPEYKTLHDKLREQLDAWDDKHKED